jgi:2-keto-4-pentenoate hydratase/2-oxohepta-3-ene-1,7-dioic acid hydratase in catechol pathway
VYKLFIARYKDKLVLAKENGYYEYDFSFEQPDWTPPESSLFVTKNNFVSELNEFPVNKKTKIICVGRNYADHAKELGNEIPTEPLLFWKPYSSLLGPKGKIILPYQSKDIQYETELVAVISKKGRNIPVSESMSYVFGYTIGLDITARDLQKSDKTWFRGKGFDTFAPVGPVIVPTNDVDLDNCSVQLFINGIEKQNGNTHDFIFKLPTIINYVSQILTLEPGDLIFTGTPEGVGKISSGDNLKAVISNIGTLEVSVE